MKDKKKTERAKRVKTKVQKRRESLRKELKDQKVHEQLMYKTRQRQTPIVNPTDSTLVRNNKVLQEMLAEHEALLQYRQDNKEKSDNMFDEMKEEHRKLAEEFKEANDESND